MGVINNNAKTIEEFFEISGDKKNDLQVIDNLIIQVAPNLKRYLFSGKSITMLAYGEVSWQTYSKDGVWPLIGLAPQKNNISMYFAVEKNGETIPTLYGKEKLGKVNNGKSCIRFQSLSDINLDVLKEAILLSIEWSNN